MTTEKFKWQEGYGAFSYSRSRQKTVAFELHSLSVLFVLINRDPNTLMLNAPVFVFAERLIAVESLPASREHNMHSSAIL